MENSEVVLRMGLLGQNVHAAMVNNQFNQVAESGHVMDQRFPCVLCGLFVEDHRHDCGVTDWRMGWVVVSKHPNPKPRSFALTWAHSEGFRARPVTEELEDLRRRAA